MTRQVVLDTETTGLDPKLGHRLIEIGCVEIVNRRLTENRWHQYINPDRDIDEGAVAVHGIERSRLENEPRFHEVAEPFLDFVRGAELIIHNAPFDVGFIDHELSLLDSDLGRLADHCTVTDTLVLARTLHPGQRNTLDALCNRYDIDNARRVLHGALLDAEILADVYLAMTGGQGALTLDAEEQEGEAEGRGAARLASASLVVRASPEELAEHEAFLDLLAKSCDDGALWRAQDEARLAALKNN